jgi:hypothetical protein
VDRSRWRKQIEPQIASLADRAGTRLRRHRAQIGPVTVELVSDDSRISEYFSRHRKTIRGTTSPDGYIYAFRGAKHFDEHESSSEPPPADTSCVLCGELGRAVLVGAVGYRHADNACQFVVQTLAARRARANTRGGSDTEYESFIAWPGGCVEYQPQDGPTRAVALLESIGISSKSDATIAVHAIGVALCKPANALVANGLVSIQTENGRVNNAEELLLLPTRLVGHFPQLTPLVAMSPSDIPMRLPLQNELAKYRDAADLARAYELGLLSESVLHELTTILTNSPGRALVDPRALLGADRVVDHATITDCVAVSSASKSEHVLRAVPAEEFAACLAPGFDDRAAAESSDDCAHGQIPLIRRFLERSHATTAVLSPLLPPAPIQFCLRHYLEGLSDSIRVLNAADRRPDDPLLAGMRVERQSSGFIHGTRPVTLVAFEKSGTRVEAVAFDPTECGFAQIKAVWPKQVADFFSRHAAINVLELFGEMRNTPPTRDT